MRTTITIALLAVLVATPALAQEWQVARERFPFAGSRLTIRVDAESRGTLRVIRGGPGSVRVASRAEQGFTAAGLAENEELTLSAAGEGPVDYMVAVPENVWIDIRLPGRSFAESVAGSTRSRTFEWARRGRSAHPPAWRPTSAPSLYTTYTRDLAPARVTLPSLANVHSLSVRIEPGPFRVATSRPLSVESGRDDHLVIRAGAPAMDIVLTVPAGSREFRIDADGTAAVIIRDGEPAALCKPVTDQRLSHDRRWLTFNPVKGRLDCEPAREPRHEG